MANKNNFLNPSSFYEALQKNNEDLKNKVDKMFASKYDNEINAEINNLRKERGRNVDGGYSEEYLKEFATKNIMEKYKKEYDGMLKDSGAIALFNRQGYQSLNLLNNKSLVLNGKFSFNNTQKFETLTPTMMEPIKNGFYDPLASIIHGNMPKVQSGRELIEKTVQMNSLLYTYAKTKTNTNVGNMLSAYDKFKNSNYFGAYDLETLGGLNSHGYRNLSDITEFSFKVYNKAKGIDAGAELKYEGLIGFNKAQEQHYLNMVDKIKRQGGFLTEEEKVIGSRLMKYGALGTKIENLGNGRWSATEFGDTKAFDINAMYNGIKELRKAGSDQEAHAALNNGVYTWQEDYINGLKLLSKDHAGDTISVGGNNIKIGDITMAGHNSITADQRWNNQYLALGKVPESLSRAFSVNGSVPYLNTDTTRVIDTLTARNVAAGYTDVNSYFPGSSKSILGKYTSGQLEAFGNSRFSELYKVKGAHTAGFDVDILARLFVDPGKGFSTTLIDQIFGDIKKGVAENKDLNTAINLSDYKRHLFVANQLNNFNESSRFGGLNFVYDSYSKSIRSFNGYEYGEDASKELFNQFGIKRNAPYAISWAGRIDLNSKGIEEFKKTMPEYAQGSLFGVTVKQVYNPEIGMAKMHHGLDNEITNFFTSEEEMQGFLAGFDRVGKLKDGVEINSNIYKTPDAWEIAKDKQKEITDRYGLFRVQNKNINAVPQKDTLKTIIDKGTYKTQNEAAARFLRQDNYKKINGFYNIYDELHRTYGSKDAVKNILQNYDANISTLIANGKPLDLYVQSQLGFKTGTGQKLYRETLDNVVSTFDYLTSMQDYFNVIKENITDSMTDEEKQMYYQTAMGEFRSASSMDAILSRKREAINNKIDARFTAEYSKDIKDYFELDVAEIGKDSKLGTYSDLYNPSPVNNILRTKLGAGAEYSLVKKVDELYGNKNTLAVKGNNTEYSLLSMKRFIGDMQGRYGDVFKYSEEELNEFSSGNSLAADVVKRLKNYREANPTSGYISETFVQDALSEFASIKDLSIEKAKAIAKNVKVNMPNFKTLTNDNFDSNIDKIVRETFMPAKNKEEFSKMVKTAGYSGLNEKHLGLMYDALLKDQKEGFSTFAKGALSKNSRFIFDTEKKIVQLASEGKAITLHSLPTVAFENGMLYSQIGNQRIAVNSLINAEGLVKFGDVSKIRLGTNIGGAWNSVNRKLNPLSMFKRSGDSSDDVLSTAQSIMSFFREEVTKAASVTTMNTAEVNKQFFVNYGDALVSSLKELHNQRFLDNVPGFDHDQFNTLFGRLMKSSDYDKKGFEDLNSSQKEFMAKHGISIMQKLADINGNEALKFVAHNLNALNNETEFGMGVGLIGQNLSYALNTFNNQQRPVPTQSERAMLYEKKKTEERLKRFLGDNHGVALNPLFENNTTKHLNTRKIKGLSDEVFTTARIGKLQTSQKGLVSTIEKGIGEGAIEKFLSTSANTFDENFKDIAKKNLLNLSIMNDAGVIDSRFANAVFARNEIQKISSRKDIMIEMNSNKETMDMMSEMRNKILPFIQVDKKTGKITAVEMKIGKDVTRYDELLKVAGYGGVMQTYRTKNDVGLFRYQWFTKGGAIPVTGSDVLEHMKDFKIANADKLSDNDLYEEAMNAIDRVYDGAFSVHRLSKQNYFKTAQGASEKSMMHSLELGLGTADTGVKKALGLMDKSFSRLYGHVLHNDDMDNLIAEMVKNKDIRNIFGTNKEDASKIISSRLYGERDALSKMLFDQILGDSPVKIREVVSQGNLKHGNTANVTSGFIDTLMHDYVNNKKLGSNEEFVNKLNDAKVFGGMDLKWEDGRIMIPEDVQGSKYFIDTKALQTFASSIDPKFTDSSVLGHKFKNGIVSTGEIVQIEDNPGGTGSDYHGDLEKKLKAYENETDPKKRVRLGKEINNLKAERSIINRGTKITEREHKMLKLQTYNDSMFKVLSNNLSKEEMREYYGYALNEEGKFKNEFKGQSVLNTLTEDLQKKMLLNDGDEKLSSILEGNKSGQYDHLIKYAENAKAKGLDIGLKQADMEYSISKGALAHAFNGGEIKSLSHMEKNNFKVIKAEDLLISRSGEGRAMLDELNSLHNDNYIVDFGAHLEGEDRFLALNRMPLRMNGEDLIPYKFQQEMRAVKAKYNALNQSLDKFKDPDARSYEDTKASLIKSIRNVKEQLGDDIFSKGGMFSELNSVRLNNSINGKANTMAYVTDKQAESGILNKATFGGKTLAENYKSERFIDSKFMSEDAFRRLGFFDEGVMRKTLLAKDVEGKTIEDMEKTMKEHLRTKGVAGLTGRYPTITEGSFSPAMHYLDDSLNQYQMKIMSFTQKAQNGDNDGDNTVSTILNMGKNGENSLYYALRHDTEEAKNNTMYRETNAYLMHRAVGINRAYEKEFQEDLTKDVEKSILNGDVNSMGAGTKLNRKVYAEMGTIPSRSKMEEHFKVAEDFRNKHNLHDMETDKFLEAADNIINTKYAEGDREAVRQSIINDALFGKLENQMVAKARKYSIGEANTPLFKLRLMGSMASTGDLDRDSNVNKFIQAGAYEIEQEVISAKKSNVRDTVTKVHEFNNALRNIIDNKDGGSKMNNWLNKYGSSLNEKFAVQAERLASEGVGDYAEFIKANQNASNLKAMLGDKLKEDFLNSIKGIRQGNALKSMDTALRVGTSTKGIASSEISKLLSNATEAGDLNTMNVIKHMHNIGMLDDVKTVSKERFDRSMKDTASYVLTDGRELLQKEASARQNIENIVKSTIGKFSNISGKGLAYGAVGVAGAMLVSAFAGGNPSKPADTHAADEAGGSDFYTIPSLGDQGVQQTNQQGYLINIKAQTPRGKEHARETVKQAMYQSTGTDVNISMNINDRSGNITDRRIEDMIMGAL